jgi:hypothetical protein
MKLPVLKVGIIVTTSILRPTDPSPPHYPQAVRLHFPAYFLVHINDGSDGHVIDNLR